MVKMQAWITAIGSSSAVSATVMASGRMAPATPSAPIPAMLTTKPAKAFNVMLPASIIANRRTEWLIGREAVTWAWST